MPSFPGLFSQELLDSLLALPEAPWQSKLKNQGSKMRALARALRNFGITPRTMRIGKARSKGYDLADFSDAFNKFLKT